MKKSTIDTRKPTDITTARNITTGINVLISFILRKIADSTLKKHDENQFLNGRIVK
jgi:hypothetical protein